MEYKKGAIQSVIQKEMLPIFHHIKELNSLKNLDYTYKPFINIYERKDSSAIAYNYYNPIGFDYFVKMIRYTSWLILHLMGVFLRLVFIVKT
jgi:hypothetical protein